MFQLLVFLPFLFQYKAQDPSTPYQTEDKMGINKDEL